MQDNKTIRSSRIQSILYNTIHLIQCVVLLFLLYYIRDDTNMHLMLLLSLGLCFCQCLMNWFKGIRSAVLVICIVIAICSGIAMVAGGAAVVFLETNLPHLSGIEVIYVLVGLLISQLLVVLITLGKPYWETETSLLIIIIYLMIEKTLLLSAESSLSEIGVTAITMGSLLICLSLVMTLKTLTKQATLKTSVKTITEVGKRYEHHFIHVSIFKDGLMIAGKLLLAIFGQSGFILVNALYSCCIMIAKSLVSKMTREEGNKQVAMYKTVGRWIMLMGTSYILYTITLLFSQPRMQYSMNLALIIALYTFVEFAFDLRDIIRLRGKRNWTGEATKMISLASTTICFVLTQTAIMSFSYEGDPKNYNILSGIMFGCIVVILGGIMIYRANRHLAQE